MCSSASISPSIPVIPFPRTARTTDKSISPSLMPQTPAHSRFSDFSSVFQKMEHSPLPLKPPSFPLPLGPAGTETGHNRALTLPKAVGPRWRTVSSVLSAHEINVQSTSPQERACPGIVARNRPRREKISPPEAERFFENDMRFSVFMAETALEGPCFPSPKAIPKNSEKKETRTIDAGGLTPAKNDNAVLRSPNRRAFLCAFGALL